jgi:hypothetical protein
VAALEKLLQDSNAKNVTLQKQVAAKDKINADLTAKTNSLEQYNRSWSVRIKKIILPNGNKREIKVVPSHHLGRGEKPRTHYVNP